jgi:flagellar protein FliT
MENDKYMSASDATPNRANSQLPIPAIDAGYQVIENYESLSSITSQMRDAAIHGEWDHLIALEQQCSRQVAAMKPVDVATSLDEQTRQRKIHLIKKILADDAEIRNRTELWTGQLQRIMQSNRQEQRLQQAYGV